MGATELSIEQDDRGALAFGYMPARTGPGPVPTYDLSPTGVWIDLATGEVVTAQPVEGVLLVAAGSPLTPDVLAAIEAAGG